VPNTSWAVGRNTLYAKALALQQKQGWRAEYLVFTDDDIELHTDDVNWNPYDLFHAALGNVQPAVASVRFHKYEGEWVRNACGPIAPCAPDIDAAVNAFHATAAPILLPYDTFFDDRDWWSSQGILIELMVASMPEHVVQFNQISITADMHRPYPKDLLCVKPITGGMSEVAKYLQPRVSKCMRDKIGLVDVGTGFKCQACEKTCACNHSADCKPAPATNDTLTGGCRTNASPVHFRSLASGRRAEPINYADVVRCKPNLNMA
jgi:hypothetical protein